MTENEFGVPIAQLKTKAGVTYDFESKASYSVTLKVTDSESGSESITVTITLIDVDEPPGKPPAPTFGTTTSTSLVVNWLEPANTGPQITDYDVQYREVTTPEPDWTDAGHTGTARTATITGLQQDTEYEVQVRATNPEDTGEWSDSGTATATDNNAPSFAQTSYSFTLAENSDGSATPVDVGMVSATDADAGDTVSYSIEAGDTGGVFAIGSDGAITYTEAERTTRASRPRRAPSR